MYIWAIYFCDLVSLQFGSKPNLYVQYRKIEIYLEIRGCDNLKPGRGQPVGAPGTAVPLLLMPLNNKVGKNS